VHGADPVCVVDYYIANFNDSRLFYPYRSFCLFILSIRALAQLFVLHFHLVVWTGGFCSSKTLVLFIVTFQGNCATACWDFTWISESKDICFVIWMHCGFSRWMRCLPMTYIYLNVSLSSKILMLLTSCNIFYAANIIEKCHRSSKLSSRKSNWKYLLSCYLSWAKVMKFSDIERLDEKSVKIEYLFMRSGKTIIRNLIAVVKTVFIPITTQNYCRSCD